MQKKANQKREAILKIDESMPADQMPDCLIKYRKILKEGKEAGKIIFTDT